MDKPNNIVDYNQILNEIIKDAVTPDEITKRTNDYHQSEIIQWIEHKGKIIRFVDCYGLNDDDLVVGIMIIERMNKAMKPGTVLRSMYNVYRLSFNTSATRALMNVRSSYFHLAGMMAAYGLSPIQKIFLRVANSYMFIAETKEQAMEWLADDKNIMYGPKCPRDGH